MHASYRDNSRQLQPAGLPNTAFSAAFLKALARLAARRIDSSTEIVVLPTGAADLGEIKLVLRALGVMRDRRAS